MIDHVSIGVRDLEQSAAFYETVLAAIGFAKLVSRENTVGFGKRYPEFWLNQRPDMERAAADRGAHVCLRAPGKELVDGFYEAALAAGADDDGAPGLRPHDAVRYYAAFVRDADGNRIEVVAFLDAESE